MRCLGDVDGVDLPGGQLVATGILGGGARLLAAALAAGAPDVAVIDIVIIGDGDAGSVAGQFAEGAIPAQELGVVVEQHLVGRAALCPGDVPLVDLVAGETEQIGLVCGDPGSDLLMWKPDGGGVPRQLTGEVLHAGEESDDQRARSSLRFLANRSTEVMDPLLELRILSLQLHPVVAIAVRLPLVDAEANRAGERLEEPLGDGGPLLFFLYLQLARTDLAGTQRCQLCGQLPGVCPHLVAGGAVLDAIDGAEGAFWMGGQSLSPRLEAVELPAGVTRLAPQVTDQAERSVDLFGAETLQHRRGDELVGGSLMTGEKCPVGALAIGHHLEAQGPWPFPSISLANLRVDQLTSICLEWSTDRPRSAAATLVEIAEAGTTVGVNHRQDSSICSGLVVDDGADPVVHLGTADGEEEATEGCLLGVIFPAGSDVGGQCIGAPGRVALPGQQDGGSHRVAELRIDAT